MGSKYLQNNLFIKPFPPGIPGEVALMAGPWVFIQGLRQSRLKRISMDITNKLKKIRIGFDMERLILPLGIRDHRGHSSD
jgi:hypothetical protein